MKIHRYTVKRLEKQTRNKKIICFGAGNNCEGVLRKVSDLKLEKRVSYIVDNNSEKWGTRKKILAEEFEIKGSEALREENWTESVVLMMIVSYKEPLKQLQEMGLGEDMTVILYPEHRFWYDKILDWLFRHLPIRRCAVFQGEGDTCENALGVVEAWKKRGFGKYRIGWFCEHPERFFSTRKERYILRSLPLKPHGLRDSFYFYSFLNRARYLIYENTMMEKVRKNQISCYMNHGIPLKATKGFIQVFEDTDYVLSPSENINSIIAEQFGARADQLVLCGEPRTDVLFRPEKKEQLTELLQLREYSKMVLWTPTFRAHTSASRRDSMKVFPFGLPLMETEEDVKRLREKLEEERVLLVIKPHIHQELSELIVEESRNIRVVKQDVLDGLGANVYDLMKFADAMITDYSSIGFDYLLLNRPIGYSIDDMKEYKIGFSVPDPFEFMPGMHMETMIDLLEFIQNIVDGKDEYEAFREERKKFLFAFPDGENGARLLDILGIK